MWWMYVGLEPTTPKIHGLSTTPIVKVIVEGIIIVRSTTTCKKLTNNNSLPCNEAL